MKVNFSKISEKDRALLSEFYESEAYVAFKKYFLDNGQMLIAQSALFASEHDRIQCQGRHLALNEINDKLKEINRKQNEVTE